MEKIGLAAKSLFQIKKQRNKSTLAWRFRNLIKRDYSAAHLLAFNIRDQFLTWVEGCIETFKSIPRLPCLFFLLALQTGQGAENMNHQSGYILAMNVRNILAFRFSHLAQQEIDFNHHDRLQSIVVPLATSPKAKPSSNGSGNNGENEFQQLKEHKSAGADGDFFHSEQWKWISLLSQCLGPFLGAWLMLYWFIPNHCYSDGTPKLWVRWKEWFEEKWG